MSFDLDRLATWFAFGAFLVMLSFYLMEIKHSVRLADLSEQGLDALAVCVKSGQGRLSVLESTLQDALGWSALK